MRWHSVGLVYDASGLIKPHHFESVFMMRLFAILLLAGFLNGSFANEAANEVGDAVIVIEPKAQPIYVAADGHRKVWKCEGLVNELLLSALFKDIAGFSKSWGLHSPQKSICLYSQTYTQTVPVQRLDVISFSVHSVSADLCEIQGGCTDRLGVRIMNMRGEFYRSYAGAKTVNGAPELFNACSHLNGKLLSESKACLDLHI